MMYTAAVIGLGNIGFQFNIDSKRKGTWSHVSAYENCEKTALVGAVEINTEKTNQFKQQYKDIPVFKSVKELMDNLRVDIVSICTPTESHYPILKELFEYSLRGIFCEKPLASNVNEARDMVQMYKEKKIVFAVNHTRRWDDHYLLVSKMIQDGKIGKVKAVNAFYPGQVFNIGTHLFDVMRMLIQKNPVTMSGISFNGVNNDPHLSGWIKFDGDIPGTIISTGKREDLIFEVDVVGDEGRLRILENGEKIEWFVFHESTSYSGYRELCRMETKSIGRRDRFVEAINDIVAVIEGKKTEVNCSERDGFYSLASSFAMLESAKQDGKPQNIHAL